MTRIESPRRPLGRAVITIAAAVILLVMSLIIAGVGALTYLAGGSCGIWSGAVPCNATGLTIGILVAAVGVPIVGIVATSWGIVRELRGRRGGWIVIILGFVSTFGLYVLSIAIVHLATGAPFGFSALL